MYLIVIIPNAFVRGMDTDKGFLPLRYIWDVLLDEDFIDEFRIKMMFSLINFCS